MKKIILPLLVILCLMGVSHADLIAHVDTTLGRITVVLQHEKAPLAVANFITLTKGTRPHVDPATGAISSKPYFVGESFFRVENKEENNVAFRIAQTGSGTGNNSGGPGYTFRDEFDVSLRHVPYVLSMANSGPNSNGSQIFFVGNSTPSHLNDVHTVFGLIPDPASRLVIDAIIAAGDNGSLIQAVSFERTSPSALAFDELAQPLPEVSAIPGALNVTPNGPVNYTPVTPFTGDYKFSLFRSENLTSWTPTAAATFFRFGNVPVSSLRIDTATSPRAFYNFVAIRYNNSPSPALMNGRTLVINAPSAGGVITLIFDASGNGGTAHDSRNGSNGTISSVAYTPDVYGATLQVQSSAIMPLFIRLSFDVDTTLLSGRQTLWEWNGFQWISRGLGTFTLTK